MAEPYARGIWARFAPTEHPFDAPTDMEDNLRTIDDHLAIYTLQAPIAPGSSLPASPVNGAGQLFSDGGYAVFNAGGWKVYPPLAGLAVMLANRTDVFVGTGLGWSSLKETLGVTALLAGQGSNIVGKATLADLNGDLGHPAETVAWVLNDVTPANNVLYRKVGAIGAGSWVPASASILGTIQVQLSTALSAIALLQSFQTETAAVLRTGYRPDVALALLDTNGRSPLQVDTFGRLLASFVGNLLGNVTGNVSGTSGGIDGVLWTVQAAQRPDIGLVVRDLNGRGVVLLDSFGRIPALTALLPQDVPYTFAAVARPDVALAVRDELGRGVVVVDAFGRSPSSTGAAATDALQLPEHRDRVLADLVAAGARYRGDFVQDRPYAARDLVRVVDRYWFYVTSSAGGGLSRLSTGYGYSAEPRWNPVEPGLIVFTYQSGGLHLAVADLQSGAVTPVPSTSALNLSHSSWCADGRHVVATQSLNAQSWLAIVDTVTGKATRLTDSKLGECSQPDCYVRRN